MPYSYLTLAQLRTELAGRLDDPSNVYWATAELNAYLVEALRCWQAHARYWRDRMQFQLTRGTWFYDLSQQTGTLVGYSVHDRDVIATMLYQLLEAQLSGSSYVGSEQFTLDDIVQSLQRRRDQFLLETGAVLTYRPAVNWPASPIGRNYLADTVVDVRRVVWISNVDGSYTQLWRSDEWAATSFRYGWEFDPSEPPLEFAVAAEAQLELGLIPPPANDGRVELVTVDAGATLDVSAGANTGILIGVPDDFAWAVKWGALSDLLSKAGEAQDLPRARYCEERWRDAVVLARLHPSIVTAWLDGKQTFLQSLAAVDGWAAGWQNLAQSSPTLIAQASWNLVAVSPAPDSSLHAVQADVLRNAPVPSIDADNIQLGRQELDALLDYAEHLAWFKVGGAEFQASVPLYENFLRVAALYNETLKASIASLEPMGDRARREETVRPRRTPVEQTQQ